MIWKVLMLLLPLLLTFAACQTQAQPFLISTVAIETTVAADDAVPSSLAEADLPTDDPCALLISLAFASWDRLREEAISPKILVGSVPSNLPFRVELPEKTTIIGSITGENELWEQIYFTTTLAPEIAIDSFRASLLEQGHVELTGNTIGGTVFAPSGNDPAGFAICDAGKSYIIWGRSFSLPDGTASIRFAIEQSGSGGPCQSMDYDPVASPSMDPLPTLIAPAGVVPLEQGGSNGFDSKWHSSELEAILPLLEIAAAYDAQLAEAGWELLEQGNNGSAAWSLWTLQDADAKPWAASRYVFKSCFG